MPDQRYTSNAHNIAVKNMQDTDRANSELYQVLTKQARDASAAKQMQELRGQQLQDQSTREQESVNSMSQKYPGRSVKTGDTSVGGTEQPNPMALANMYDRQDARADRQQREVADRVDKQGIPETSQALAGVDRSFKGASVGPIMNAMPTSLHGPAANIKSRLGELLGKPEWQGAGEEYQDLNRLMNIDTRNFAGSAQTAHEMGRQMSEKGLGMGGSTDQVRQGIEMMRQASQENVKNIEAGSATPGLQRYTESRGIKSLQDLIPVGHKAGVAGQRAPVKQVRNKSTGKVGTLMSDGTVEY